MANPLLTQIGPGTPIRQLLKLQRRPLDFPFHVWGTRISQELEARIPETAERLVGCGISEDNEQAIAAACGEALERYVFALTSDLLATLPIHPPDDSLSADFLFKLPFLLPRTVSRQEWCQQAVHSPRRVLPCWQLGAQGQLFDSELPVEFLTPTVTLDLFQTTNGMACSSSLMDAIDRGLREVIERDALMLVWLYRVGGKLLPSETLLPRPYLAASERMQEQNITTRLRDISADSEYRVILGIVGYFPPEGQPIFGFGAGADSEASRAAAHAFREACLGWKAVASRVGREESDLLVSEESDSFPHSFAEHAALYFAPEMLPNLSFLFDSELTNNPAQAENTSKLLDGKEVYIIDLTTPDVKAMGAYVVKVIVPGLVPFYFADFAADELAATRLPTAIGGMPISTDCVPNPLPHPWP